MSVVKNRSTPKDREFWDHVESVAAQSKKLREGAIVSEKPEIPEDLKLIYQSCEPQRRPLTRLSPEDIRELIERIAALTAEIARLKAQRVVPRENTVVDVEGELEYLDLISARPAQKPKEQPSAPPAEAREGGKK